MNLTECLCFSCRKPVAVGKARTARAWIEETLYRTAFVCAACWSTACETGPFKVVREGVEYEIEAVTAPVVAPEVRR